jgi:hypothetical protein
MNCSQLLGFVVAITGLTTSLPLAKRRAIPFSFAIASCDAKIGRDSTG